MSTSLELRPVTASSLHSRMRALPSRPEAPKIVARMKFIRNTRRRGRKRRADLWPRRSVPLSGPIGSLDRDRSMQPFAHARANRSQWLCREPVPSLRAQETRAQSPPESTTFVCSRLTIEPLPSAQMSENPGAGPPLRQESLLPPRAQVSPADSLLDNAARAEHSVMTKNDCPERTDP